MIEKFIKKHSIYKGKVLELFCDNVTLPNGASATREYINLPGASAVLAFIDDSNIVLVRQFRYAINQVTYEIPAGKIDYGETPLDCALRELKEETGYHAKKINKILSFCPSTAFSTEFLHVFTAFDLQKGIINTDEDEFIETKIFSFQSVLEMVENGQIIDAKTIIAILSFKNSLS